ncbi:hypothetical protein [Streptomyces sp. NPDC048611]|uniref:hypothetical protein n=1 Tax=Streptomyces sp. NPDC048611 TaxID=3155635 RepID=UPI003446EE9B
MPSTTRGQDPATASAPPAGDPLSLPVTGHLPGRDHKPTAAPAAPFLPLEPGDWDIPRVPLSPATPSSPPAYWLGDQDAPGLRRGE